MAISLLIGLTLAASLSPLLTFGKLFQLKEWRWDRLSEHLRHKGTFKSLFGALRPTIVACFLIAAFFIPARGFLALIVVSTLTLLNMMQFAVKKQPAPVWTAKALLIVTLSLFITFLLSLLLTKAAVFVALPFLVLLQPTIVLLAWSALRPLDDFLKKRVMNRAAELREHHPEATVIAVAGSVGKTTTKELLKQLLHDLHPLVTPAHVNTEMGVAKWLTQKFSSLETRDSKLVTIVEMGAYAKGEIELLCKIAQPTIGVMTRLGSDHLALFGSEEAIRDANAEMLEALPTSGHAFILGDDAESKALKDKADCPTTIIETKHATNVHEKADGLHFTVESHTLHLPIHGAHNISNALLAIAVARHLGISWDRIKEQLASFHVQSHTFSVHDENGVTVLDDTYNISPLSFAAALEWAKARPERPRILLTAGLLETGSEEARFHKELGLAANGAVERAIFLDAPAARAFGAGWKGDIELLDNLTEKAPKGSLLLCLGRMPLSKIQKLLP